MTLYSPRLSTTSRPMKRVLGRGTDAGRGGTTPPALNFTISLIILGLSPEVNNVCMAPPYFLYRHY